MTEYAIVFADSVHGMAAEVRRYLDLGWELYGQLIAVECNGKLLYRREMVKEVE